MKLGTTAVMSLRADLAASHLRAAVRAARNAQELELTNDTTKIGPWFEEIMCLVPVSVVMAGAALEANVNEQIQDILDKPAGTLSDARRLLLTNIKDDRTGNSLDKYLELALLFDKVADKGCSPWEQSKTLVEFRNFFMHFKPAWQHGDEPPQTKLARALSTKLPLAGPYRQTMFTFPHALMTYECAKWSVRTALDFSKYFSGLLNIADRLAPWRSQLILP
jgi:hypothetical protein